MTRRRIVVRILMSVAATAVVAIYSLYQHREGRMEELFARAGGATFEGGDASLAAVRELGAYTGARSTQMLIAVAEGRVPLPWPTIQAEAVRTLASRRDPSVSRSVANLLQPHVSLPVREAAAQALKTLPCSRECVAAVLHYLERVWWGEPQPEDRGVEPTGPSSQALYRRVRARLAQEQEALYQDLYAVLRREEEFTLESLVQVYGLGTPEPSKFVLALTARMHLTGACPAVLSSAEGMAGTTPEILDLPREEVKGALQSLGCR